MRLARAWGAVDAPTHRKIHKEATPLLGGLAIFIGMWSPLLLLTFYDNSVTERLAREGWHKFSLIFAAGLAMLLLGILDDKKGLNARWKFGFQLPVALALVLAGLHFDSFGLPGVGSVDLGGWGPLLSVLWIVGITNALNLIDGVDGLATGVAFFVSVTTAVVASLNGNALLAVVMCSMAGGCLGFLRYNFAPARIFLGDTGSLFLGVTLAVTAMMANTKGTVAASMLVPILLLGYPALDTLLTMFHRALRGKSMFAGDRGHIHHRLLARGLGHEQVALILYLVCALFCTVGVATMLGNALWTGLGLLALAVLFGFGLWVLGYLGHFSPRARRERPLYKVAYHFGEMSKERLKLASEREEVFGVLREACVRFGVLALKLNLPETPLGPACQFQLLLEGEPDLGFPQPGRNATSREPVEDEHHFPDTLLAAWVSWNRSADLDELQLEYRSLVGELLEAANRRLGELIASRAPRPRSKGDAPNRAEGTDSTAT
jgi:UDP-GlcNAc:undecaprenyl-phosphate GlcNAc-1-phosphate transferase